MIIVTQRLGLPHQLETVVLKRWGVHHKRPLRCFKTLHDLRVHEVDVSIERRHQLAVFDLESIAHDLDGAVKIIEWLSTVPWLHPVMVVTTTRVRDQVLLLNAIKTSIPSASMLFGTDVGSCELWDDIYSKTITNVQGAGLYKDLVQLVLDRQEVFVEQELVLDILGAAPRAHQVTKLARLVGRTRGVLWKQLTDAGQLEPSELLTLFHLLYAVHLRDLHWTPDIIARYLQFSSNREFVRRMCRRLGMHIGVFFTRSYADVLDWASHTLAVQPIASCYPCKSVSTLKQSAGAFGSAAVSKPAVRIVPGIRRAIIQTGVVLLSIAAHCDTVIQQIAI